MVIVRWGSTKWHVQTKVGLICGVPLSIERDNQKLNILTVGEIKGYPRTVCGVCFRT